MGALLTSGSTLSCPHGGTVVAVPSGSRVRVAGNPIVVATDTFTVAGCPFAPTAPHPCVRVQWQLTDLRSTVGGAATLAADSIGFCVAADGAVQGTVLVQATQAKVQGR